MLHPINTCFVLHWELQGSAGASPSCQRLKELMSSSPHREKTTIQLKSKLTITSEYLICLTSMFLDCGRKAENPERNLGAKGRTCKLRKVRVKLATFFARQQCSPLQHHVSAYCMLGIIIDRYRTHLVTSYKQCFMSDCLCLSFCVCKRHSEPIKDYQQK